MRPKESKAAGAPGTDKALALQAQADTRFLAAAKKLEVYAERRADESWAARWRLTNKDILLTVEGTDTVRVTWTGKRKRGRTLGALKYISLKYGIGDEEAFFVMPYETLSKAKERFAAAIE